MIVLHYSDREESGLASLFGRCDILITTGDLNYLDFISIENQTISKPAFGVYGNHCNPGYLEKLGIVNVHLQTIRYRDFIIGGYQGSPRYKKGGGPQYTEDEAWRDLQNFPGVDILLLHAPPFGLLDTPGDAVHEGSKAVRAYVDRTSPKYIFCGHESPSMELKYNNTSVYRTHKARLIEI